MKKLGLVGGTGPESTLVYYRDINRLAFERSNQREYPEILIESVDLIKALSYVANEEYATLRYYLRSAISNLIAGGADIVCLTAGTMHIVYDDLKPQIPVPFISIPETVAKETKGKGYKRVGLIGTIFTMEKTFLKKDFWENDIEVFVPEKEDREIINDIIYNELEQGIVKPESVEILLTNIDKLKREHDIDAVILGCTELPLAINATNCPIPVIDIMQVHIKKLVDLIME